MFAYNDFVVERKPYDHVVSITALSLKGKTLREKSAHDFDKGNSLGFSLDPVSLSFLETCLSY